MKTATRIAIAAAVLVLIGVLLRRRPPQTGGGNGGLRVPRDQDLVQIPVRLRAASPEVWVN